MDDQQFDALVKTLGNDGSRRGVVQILGASALAGVFGRLTGIAVEAKKKGKKKRKKKKCKGDTRKCGKKCIPADRCCVDADCNSSEVCDSGFCRIVGQACVNDDDCPAPFVCIDDICIDPGNQVECQNNGDCKANEVCENGVCVFQGECQNNGECAANESCVGGECLCIFPQKKCFGGGCCAADEACVLGQCLVGVGTCAGDEDICAGDEDICNDDPLCTCGQRLDGQIRCMTFINDSRNNCTCGSDSDCETDFGEGAICIKGGSGCECQNEQLGRCARLCETQVGI